MNITEAVEDIPKNIDDIILPKRIRQWVDKLIEDGVLKTCIFYGDAGKGKTTLARYLTNTLDYNVKEVDASKDRGVDFIRCELEPFLNNYSGDIRPKAIIMDECEMLTEVAIKSLKKSIEEYARLNGTVFIFITNEFHKMDKTIVSRAPEISFDHESHDELKDIKNQVYKKVIRIFKDCGVKGSKDNIVTYINDHAPDIRSTFNRIPQYIQDNVFQYTGNRYLSNSYVDAIKLIASEPSDFFSIMVWLSDQSKFQPSKIINNLYGEFCRIIDDQSNELLPMDRGCIIDITKILADYSHKLSYSLNPQISMRAMMIELCEEESIKSLSKIDFKRYTSNESYGDQ